MHEWNKHFQIFVVAKNTSLMHKRIIRYSCIRGKQKNNPGWGAPTGCFRCAEDCRFGVVNGQFFIIFLHLTPFTPQPPFPPLLRGEGARGWGAKRRHCFRCAEDCPFDIVNCPFSSSQSLPWAKRRVPRPSSPLSFRCAEDCPFGIAHCPFSVSREKPFNLRLPQVLFNRRLHYTFLVINWFGDKWLSFFNFYFLENPSIFGFRKVLTGAVGSLKST